MNKLPNGPLALSLSGGGSKGAYTIGLLQYLVEVKNRRDFKIIYGTSTGALIAALFGASIVTKDLTYFYELINIYSTVLTEHVIIPNHDVAYHLAGGGIAGELTVVALLLADQSNKPNSPISIYNTDPLLGLIDRYLPLTLWEKIIQAGQDENPIEIGFCATNLQTGESEIITNISHPDPAILRKALLASANQPIFMPPVKIFDDSKHQYVDGGLIDYNPIEKVFLSPLLNQVKGILSINLDTPGAEASPWIHQKIDTVFLRTLEILAKNVQNEDLNIAQLWNVLLKMKDFLTMEQWQEFLNTLHSTSKDFIENHLINKHYVPIMHIYPEETIKMNALRFNQPEMSNLIKKGFNDAKKFF